MFEAFWFDLKPSPHFRLLRLSSSLLHHKHTSTGIIQQDAAPKLLNIIAEAMHRIFD